MDVREFHILNFGCGVQSTAIALMVQDGDIRIPTANGKFDAAVFADTQEEPAAVYQHLAWMERELSYPLVVRTAGRLGDDLLVGENTTGQRFASIPAFTSATEGEATGMVRRQCTKEYKVEVIEKWIRRELLSLEPRQRIPKDVQIVQYMGFSTDEPGRAANARNRFAQQRWGRVEFPLWADDVWMSRADCERYNVRRVPHPVPRSACTCCPFRSNAEWREMKANDPDSFARAVEIDNGLRKPGSIVNRGLDQHLYLHRKCRPLEQIDFTDNQKSLFDAECEGGCGL